MVNMYGAGQAFNLRYQQRTVAPPPKRQIATPQRQAVSGHCCHTTQNITIKGPSGFWNFASGLLSGLSSGGLFGGGWSSFGTINQAQMQQPQVANQDKLGNLKALFPKFNIVSEGNGKYSATDSDGNGIGKNLTYDEMYDALKAKQESNGKTAVNNNEEKQAVDGKEEKQTVNDNEEKQIVNDNEEGKQAVNNRTNNSKGKGINLDGWYKAYSGGSAEGNNGVKFSTCQNAQQVCNKLLQGKMDYLGSEDRTALTKEIIAKNPSVFNEDGSLKPGNNWHKLDIPKIDHIKNQYVAEGETINDGAGNISYVSNTTGEISTRRSQISRDTTAQNMGFSKTPHRDIYQKGNNYYKYVDNKFTPLTADETNALNGKTQTGQSYRPTARKGIYYNQATQKHYIKTANGSFAQLRITENGKTYDVKQINSNGTWYDSEGNAHKTIIKEQG